MYFYDEKDGYIKCSVNATIVAKMVTRMMAVTGRYDENKEEEAVYNRHIVVRQGLEKKKVLRNIKMDLPNIAQKCKMDPENDDPPLFGLLNDEDIDVDHNKYLTSDLT